jgi:hypothetical protein
LTLAVSVWLSDGSSAASAICTAHLRVFDALNIPQRKFIENLRGVAMVVTSIPD